MLELRKKYKSGSALEILQEAILSGDLQSGTIITQTELASSLEVSRMPVREALIALEYQGLIERLPGQHIRVAALSDEYIRAIFTDMGIIEAEILKSLTPEELMLLSSSRSQQEFHGLILQYTKAPLRRKFLGVITEVYLPFVLNSGGNDSHAEAVFANLLCAVRHPEDTEILRSCYAVYSGVISGGMIKIRKGKSDAQS